MASSILKVASRAMLARRVVSLMSPSLRNNSYAAAERAALQDLSDPNLNHAFMESLIEPIPTKPRTIGFTDDIKDLKEREKGDWKNLSVEEHMDLYNLYFSMSMADMCRGDDQWKTAAGLMFFIIAFALITEAIFAEYVAPPKPRSSTDPEWVKAVIKKRIQFHDGHLTGYASKWDYENNCWKK